MTCNHVARRSVPVPRFNFCKNFFPQPGGGASPAGDGWPAAKWRAAGGIKFGSLEVTEVRFALLFRRHEFRPDCGGTGKSRRGTGGVAEILVETAEPAVGNTAGATDPGPAIVESAMTTVLLRPGEHAIVSRLGWFDIAIGSGRPHPREDRETNGYR